MNTYTTSGLSSYESYMSNFGPIRGSCSPFSVPKKSFSKLFISFFGGIEKLSDNCLKVLKVNIFGVFLARKVDI